MIMRDDLFIIEFNEVEFGGAKEKELVMGGGKGNRDGVMTERAYRVAATS